MSHLTLSSPVSEISHIGRSVEKQLKHLEILTVQDLLFYFPARYDDLSQITPIKAVRVGERAVVRGRIELIASVRSKWRHKLLTNAVVSDATGSVRVLWFNQPWIAKMFKSGDELYLVGDLKDDGSGAYFSSPAYEKVGKGAATHAGRIVPVYPSTEKLSQKQIRFLVKRALPLARAVDDPLPYEVCGQYHLISLTQALSQVHFPSNYSVLEQAQRRLKFDELLHLQIVALSLKRELKKVPAPLVAFQEQATKQFVYALPFKLTDDQRKAAWEIVQDLGKARPMNRLLEGEVGSGKTVVVAIAALNAVLGFSTRHPERSPQGEVEGSLIVEEKRSLHSARASVEMTDKERGQVAIMAPTEILARQHFGTFVRFLAPHNVCVGLLTQSAIRVSESGIMNHELRKKEMVKKVREGEVDVLVGTQALISAKGGSAVGGQEPSVHFQNLVLAVVDEQHRFGVEQRSALKSKRSDGLMPHLLSLTATPIPRSLALVFYGDLDISILKEMPKGRQRIETQIVNTNERTNAHEFIRAEIKKCHQVFWTCPIIDPSDTLGVNAATEVFEHLRTEVFPDLRVGLLHGRMKSKERERAMQEFLEQRIDILVATPVIEVGIDVPNATVMVIEGAERFGLAQLHQFRGRVGRGEAQSHCLLMVEGEAWPASGDSAIQGSSSAPSQFWDTKAKLRRKAADAPKIASPHRPATPLGGGERGWARLRAFLESTDGFALAERDLELRGPGEIYGKAQSGFPEFRIASFADVDIAKEAKAAAQWILQKDPELISYPQLKKAILDREKWVHLE